MEGFDAPRVKPLLGVPKLTEIVIAIAAGKNAEGCTIPQVRFER
jgi:hypothetical protein